MTASSRSVDPAARLEVLALVADGATNRVAGERLHLSEARVKTHLLRTGASTGAHCGLLA